MQQNSLKKEASESKWLKLMREFTDSVFKIQVLESQMSRRRNFLESFLRLRVRRMISSIQRELVLALL